MMFLIMHILGIMMILIELIKLILDLDCEQIGIYENLMIYQIHDDGMLGIDVDDLSDEIG